VLAGLPQVLKGYGDTQVRGRENYARLWALHVAPVLGGTADAEQVAPRLREALRTTLADPEGKLNQAHRAAPGPKAQPVFWAAKAPPRETTVTPHA